MKINFGCRCAHLFSLNDQLKSMKKSYYRVAAPAGSLTKRAELSSAVCQLLPASCRAFAHCMYPVICSHAGNTLCLAHTGQFFILLRTLSIELCDATMPIATLLHEHVAAQCTVSPGEQALLL